MGGKQIFFEQSGNIKLQYTMFNVGLLRCIYFPTVKLDSLERFQSSLSIMHIMLGDLSTMRKKNQPFKVNEEDEEQE